MKKILLSLSILLSAVGMGAHAQGEAEGTTPSAITEVNQLTNNAAYTIKSVNRGYLYHETNVTPGEQESPENFISSTWYKEERDKTPTNDGNTPTEQFGFLKGNYTPAGEYYIYNMAAGKFVTYKGTDVALHLTDTPESKWLVEKNGDKFTIKVPGTDKTYINITNFGAKFGCKVFGTGPDDGNRMTITNVCSADFSEAVRKINLAEAKALLKEGVGYPATTSTAYSDLKNLNENNTVQEIQAAVDAYYACEDIELPVSGKAYTIKAWWKTRELPVTFFESTVNDVFVGQTPGYAPNTASGAQATKFVCQKVGNKFLFVSDNGYYFGWQASGKGSYTSNTYAENQPFEIKKAYIGNGSINDNLTTNDLLGKVCLQAIMEKGLHNLMFSQSSHNFHNSQALSTFYSNNAHTVYYTMEEVSEADYTTNVVKVNEKSEMDGSYVATYYAPYATTLPEGWKAYTINSVNEQTSKANLKEVTGDIPANTGVIVFATSHGQAKVNLSTSNPATIEGNLLKGSATDSYVPTTNAYVLGKGNNGVGLYRPEGNKNAEGAAGTTHFKNNAGKAYLVAPGTAAMSLSFGFDDGTTGIEETENSVENAKTVIYDLCGRRVSKAGKGLYIVNGKKVIR